MKIPILFLFSLLFLSQCHSKQSLIADPSIDKTHNILSEKDELKQYSSADKIIGIWTDRSSENATFRFRKDSIYYVDQGESYPYELIGDSIKIKYTDWVFSGKVSFEKEILVIDSENGRSKYYRYEK